MPLHLYVTSDYLSALQVFIGVLGIVIFGVGSWYSFRQGHELRILFGSFGVGLLVVIGGLFVGPMFNPPKTCTVDVSFPLAHCADGFDQITGRQVILEGDYRYQAGVITPTVANLTQAEYQTLNLTKAP